MCRSEGEVEVDGGEREEDEEGNDMCCVLRFSWGTLDWVLELQVKRA